MNNVSSLIYTIEFLKIFFEIKFKNKMKRKAVKDFFSQNADKQTSKLPKLQSKSNKTIKDFFNSSQADNPKEPNHFQSLTQNNNSKNKPFSKSKEQIEQEDLIRNELSLLNKNVFMRKRNLRDEFSQIVFPLILKTPLGMEMNPSVRLELKQDEYLPVVPDYVDENIQIYYNKSQLGYILLPKAGMYTEIFRFFLRIF